LVYAISRTRLRKVPIKKSLLIVGLIASSMIVAAFATGVLQGPSFIRITESSSYADTVTIYQNGFTFVTYAKTVGIQGETSVIQLYLPAGALIETLRVEGINILEIRFGEKSHPLLEKGDVITVHTEDRTYTGKFISWDGWLLLEVNNGTIMITPEKITAIELQEVVQVQGLQSLVEILTDSAAGEYTLKVSYLMRGPGWKPTYLLELDAARLEYWILVENPADWSNVTLTVVSGGPHVVYRGLFVPNGNVYYAEKMAAAPDWSEAQVEEYHEYTLDRKITFQSGVTVKLPLLEGIVDLRQEYFWSAENVVDRYHVSNLLSEPLSAGIIEVYRGSKWVGEDLLAYTPAKANSTVIVGYAFDIKVAVETVKEVYTAERDVIGKQITVRNYKESSISILIEQTLPYRANLVSSDPEATVKGSTLTWTINVDASGSATIYYEYEQIRTA